MDEQTQAEQLDAFDEADDGIRLEDMPPDTQWGAQAYGAGGADAPETLAARAARENPDQLSPDDDIAIGLYEPGDPMGDDTEADLVGELDNTPGPGHTTAEEAAVHVVDEEYAVRAAGLDPDGPPGDGYVDVDGELRKADDGLPGDQTAGD